MNFQVPEEPDNEDLFVTAPFSSSNALHAGLHDMESTLRCPICHDFFNVPVSIIKCHHSFCSLCIQKHVKEQKMGMNRCASCPVCRTSLPAGDETKFLIPNHTVEELVHKYSALRDNLASQLLSNGEEDSKKPASTTQDDEGEVEGGAEPKRRRTTRSSSTTLASADPQAAPSRESRQEAQERPQRRRTTHYNSLKKKDLVALCAQEGLLTNGTDVELKRRHEEFVKQFNANCDSRYPEPARKIAARVNQQEMTRKQQARGTQADTARMAELKENRKQMGSSDSPRGIAKTGNAEFNAKLSSGFEKLIQSMPRRTKRPYVDKTLDDTNEATAASVDSEMTEVEQDQDAADATGSSATNSTSAGDDEKREAVASVSTSEGVPAPASNGSDMSQSSSDSTVPRNPYASTPAARKTDRVSPTSVSDSKLSNATASSSRKRSSGLMTSYLQASSTPATARKPSSSQSSQQSTSSTSSSRSTCTGPWVCPKCTFLNEENTSRMSFCEMCHARRPPTNEAPPTLSPGAPPKEPEVILLDV